MQTERKLPLCRKVRGFSMIELVTVIAILGIMVAFAVPSFQEFVVNYRTSVQTNDLLSDLAIARNEAVKYARRTEVRAAAGNWTDGWIVGTDLDASGTIDDDEIVKRHGAAEVGFAINAGDTGGTDAPVVAFGVTGTVVLPAGNNNLEFEICRPDGDPAKSRGVLLARSGRAASQKAANNTSYQC